MDRIEAFLDECGKSFTTGTIFLAAGFLLFFLLERIFSLKPIKKPWRSYKLDLQYAFLSMLYPPFIDFILAAVIGLLALRHKGSFHNPHLSVLSFAVQMMIYLFVRDILIYVRHRIFHTRPVWAFHSIHHASEEVNWLSAARFHPAENIIETSGEALLAVTCLLMGMDAAVISPASLFIGFYNLFIHSNIRWTFGPLRYVLVSPVFHRWHHSDSPAAQDKNFAAMFSCLDLALGTFYMPMNAMPETTGLSTQEKTVHPRTLAGQLWYPFQKR